MKRGDKVVFLADPLLFGVGIVRVIRSDGLISVEFDGGTFEAFMPHELELEQAWTTAA